MRARHGTRAWGCRDDDRGTGKATLLLDGLYFGEGPRWHDGRLYFSDFFDHAVKAVDLDGEVETIVEVPNFLGGSAGCRTDACSWCPCATGRSCVSIPTASSSTPTCRGSPFDCNDMVVDALGGRTWNFGFDLHAFIHEQGVEGALAEAWAAEGHAGPCRSRRHRACGGAPT